MLEIESLSHRYEAHFALRSVSLTIAQQTGVVGLLGSNGAGKSTLMNIICGCLNATSGSVRVDGHDVSSEPLEVRRLIGFLPQQPPLSLELTITEFLTFCAEIRGVERKSIALSVDESIDRCGLGVMRHRLIGNLSGGYRQRVGIAQAIIHKPSLVVFDEPTVGLDPNQIDGVRRLVEEIGSERMVLFSTHILSEVDALCRDVVMIEHGQVVFDSSIEEFRDVSAPNTLVLSCANLPSIEEVIRVDPRIHSAEQIDHRRIRLWTDGTKSIGQSLISHGSHWGIEELYFEGASLDDVFRVLSKEAVA